MGTVILEAEQVRNCLLRAQYVIWAMGMTDVGGTAVYS